MWRSSEPYTLVCLHIQVCYSGQIVWAVMLWPVKVNISRFSWWFLHVEYWYLLLAAYLQILTLVLSPRIAARLDAIVVRWLACRSLTFERCIITSKYKKNLRKRLEKIYRMSLAIVLFALFTFFVQFPISFEDLVTLPVHLRRLRSRDPMRWLTSRHNITIWSGMSNKIFVRLFN